MAVILIVRRSFVSKDVAIRVIPRFYPIYVSKLGDSGKPKAAISCVGPSQAKRVKIPSTGRGSAARRTLQRCERGDLLCGDTQYRLLDRNRRL